MNSAPCAEGIAASAAHAAAAKAKAAAVAADSLWKALKDDGDRDRAAVIRAMLPALKKKAKATEEAAAAASAALHAVQLAWAKANIGW